MGCPANKVLKGCAGAALMGDLRLAEEIIVAVKRAVSLPVTVKFRLGLDDCRSNYLELGRMCEANGVAAVAMHARTARQMFGGDADWSHIARLKETLSIPVIGNGDVRDAEDAVAALARDRLRRHHDRARRHQEPVDLPPDRGAAGGRRGHGADAGRPTRPHPPALPLGEPSASRAASRSTSCASSPGWYTHGLPNGRKLRQRINDLPDAVSFLQAVEDFFGELMLEQAA